MNFYDIIHEITNSLSGNHEKDIEYLQEQSEKYKDHEYSKEILRAIGRIIYDLLPSDKKDKVTTLINNHQTATEKVLEEVKFQMYKRDLNKALEIFQSFIPSLNDEKDKYADDKVSEYHCFNNFLEELIYKITYKPTKEIRQTPENLTELYYLYGNLLFELKKYNEAFIALSKAEKYNCIYTEIKFEKGELYKLRKDWNNFLDINRNCLEFAYSSNALARVYRNFAFYYTEIGKYDIAIALLSLSTHYEKSTMVQSELMYNFEKTGKKVERSSFEIIKEILKQEDIQLGPNPLILEICASLGNQAKDEHPEAALFFFSIFYDLSGDEEVKKIIEELEKKVKTK